MIAFRVLLATSGNKEGRMRSGVRGRLKIQAASCTTKPEAPEVLVMSISTTAKPPLHARPATRHPGEGTVPRHSRTHTLVKRDTQNLCIF